MFLYTLRKNSRSEAIIWGFLKFKSRIVPKITLNLVEFFNFYHGGVLKFYPGFSTSYTRRKMKNSEKRR